MATEASIEYLTRPSQIDVDVDVTSSVSEISRRGINREKRVSWAGARERTKEPVLARAEKEGATNRRAG